MNNLEALSEALHQVHDAMRASAERAGKDPRRNAHIVRVGLLAHAAVLIAEGRGDEARRVIHEATDRG